MAELSRTRDDSLENAGGTNFSDVAAGPETGQPLIFCRVLWLSGSVFVQRPTDSFAPRQFLRTHPF